MNVKNEDESYVTEIRTGADYINERGRKDYRRIRRDRPPSPHPLLKRNGHVSNECQCFDNWNPNDSNK